MIRSVHHAAIRVSDLSRSVSFYTQVLGLTVLERRSLPSADIVFLGIPGSSGTLLELVSGRTDHHRGDGLVHHIAFTVDDVHAAFQRLRSLNVTMISEQPQEVWEGKTIAFFRGPDGERLEICGP